tara:strand:+ start:8318 stop:9283 length:966 start_codon:yes stop_codon:yes gene_type:complete
MVKQIILPEICSEEDLDTVKGHHLDDGWIHHLIDEDCDIFTASPDNPMIADKFILSFRKKCLVNTAVGFDNYKKLVAMSRGRGASAGPIVKDAEFWLGKELLIRNNGFTTGYMKDGKPSKMTVNNSVYSTVAGYFDKMNTMGKNLPCRMTNHTKKNFKNYEEGLPFIQEIASYYQDIRPVEFNKQNCRADLKKDFKITGTPFSTITINRNFRTALHKDSGDFGGFACLSVLEEGQYNGGIFMIPRYGIGVNMRHGDLLIADVHQYHCNTEIWTTEEQDKFNVDNAPSFKNMTDTQKGILGGEQDFSRLSFVCYLREKMIKC